MMNQGGNNGISFCMSAYKQHNSQLLSYKYSNSSHIQFYFHIFLFQLKLWVFLILCKHNCLVIEINASERLLAEKQFC